MNVSHIRELARSGDPCYQFLLGFVHEYGICATRSKYLAKEQYVKAAEQGFTPAQYALAVLIDQQGEAVDDQNNAVFWCKKAAEAGYAPAQYLLGVFYEAGGKVETNPELAFHHTKLAAEQGFAPAIADMARMYEEGIGVEPDRSAARNYLREAAEKGDAGSAYMLGSALIKQGDENGDERSIAEGLQWIWKSANLDDVNANGFLGRAYAFGLYGFPKDLKLAEHFQARGWMTGEE